MATAAPQVGLALARIGLGLLLVAAAFVVMRPFVVPMVWAATLAFMTWGPYERVRRASGHPHITAVLFTLGVVVLVGLPAVWLFVAGIAESIQLLQAVQAWIREGATLPPWLAQNRWFGPPLERALSETLAGQDLAPRLLAVGSALSKQVVAIAGSVAQNAFAFVVTLLSLYVFYVDGERVAAHGRRLFAWLFPNRPPNYLDHIGAIVRAVVLAIVGTAVLQGAIAGLGFAIFGVPYAVGLGALTTLAAFVPGGPVFVWGGGVVWLLVQGHTVAGIGLAVWGALLVSSLDNVVRPLLIQRSGASNLPFLLILFGVLGGLAAMGLLGLLFGPVVLAVCYALVSEMPEEAEAPAAGQSGAS
jgi:predicted PurR-regulated permease PerM